MHSANNWEIRAVIRSAIRARQMQKDQLLAEHTIPPSGIVTLRNGRRGNAGQSVWLKQRR